MIAELHPHAGWMLAFAALIFVGAPIAMCWLMYRAKWKHTPTPAEIGFTPLATFRTSMRAGPVQRWGYPFVRVSAYTGFVVIVATPAPFFGSSSYLLRTEDRIRLVPGRFLWTRHVRILHVRCDVPAELYIIARSRDRQALIDALQLSVHARIGHGRDRFEESA